MYAIVVLQGLASAVPWNVFVTESEYLALRVHRPPFLDLIADNFESVNNIVSQAGWVSSCCILMPDVVSIAGTLEMILVFISLAA